MLSHYHHFHKFSATVEVKTKKPGTRETLAGEENCLPAGSGVSVEPDMQISIHWLQAERVPGLESTLLGDWAGTRTPRKGCELLSVEQELAEVCEAERNMNPF